MTCKSCQHDTVRRFGYYGKRKVQRYRCTYCSTTFSETPTKIGNHYTDPDTAIRALSMMLEGVSIRGISRLTGLHLETILALMNTAAGSAKRVFDERVRDIQPKYVQLDELWTYCGCHGRKLRSKSPEGWGDQWTWLALDSESKMILSYRIGARNTVNAFAFVKDLSRRTRGVYQITSDALRGYVGAIEEWYGADVRFAQLRKIYGRLEAGPEWYGFGKVIAAVPNVIMGDPDYSHISTSHIERTNSECQNAPEKIHSQDQCSEQERIQLGVCCDAVRKRVELLADRIPLSEMDRPAATLPLCVLD